MADVQQLFEQAVQVHRSGNAEAAAQLYRQLLEIDPQFAPGWCNLGVATTQLGKPEDAIAIYQTSLRLDPKYTDAHFNLGNAFRRLQRFAESVGCYQRVLQLSPKNSSAAHNLGISLANLGRLPQAIDAQKKAIEFEPNFADARLQLSDLYLRTGQVDEAIRVLKEYQQLRPTDPRGYHNLALIVGQLGQMDQAFNLLKQALQLNPGYAEAHNGLGVLLDSIDRGEEAYRHYVEAVKLKPKFADALNNLGGSCVEIGLIEYGINYRKESLLVQPNAPHIHSNLLLSLHYSPSIPPEAVRAEHEAWSAAHADRYAPVMPPRLNDPNPDRVLRIGYISSDFRQHTVAAFLLPLLKNHDHTRFHITAFSNASRPDALTEQMKPLTDGWHDIARMTDDDAANLIRKEKIDILVDTNGHTASNRLLVLARKPAPIQATVFGYPDTTGMKMVDYRITDLISEPPGTTEAYSVERLFHLPETAWVYEPPLHAPEVAPTPAEKSGFVVFGSLNNLAKVSDALLERWVKILKLVNNSKLILLMGKGGFGRERIGNRLQSLGVLPDRVLLAPRLKTHAYLDLHKEIDIYLDPDPYNGGVTSMDALWMGCPIVTLAGKTYVSRQGTMLLTHLGLQDWIAKTPEDYISIAVQKAGQIEELKQLRSTMRDRIRNSPMMNGERYVRNLESAYRTMWTERIGGK
jgi:protein O-GlcNAc transferase